MSLRKPTPAYKARLAELRQQALIDHAEHLLARRRLRMHMRRILAKRWNRQPTTVPGQ